MQKLAFLYLSENKVFDLVSNSLSKSYVLSVYCVNEIEHKILIRNIVNSDFQVFLIDQEVLTNYGNLFIKLAEKTRNKNILVILFYNNLLALTLNYDIWDYINGVISKENVIASKINSEIGRIKIECYGK